MQAAFSYYVFSYFHFGFEGRIWDLIVSVPNHCLSFYFERTSFEIKIVSIFTGIITFHLGRRGSLI